MADDAGPSAWDDLATLAEIPRRRTAPEPNEQTPEVFAEQAAAVSAAAPPVIWRRPSDHDPDRPDVQEVEASETADDLLEGPRPVGAGRIRGILLHKLMEELLSGELAGDGPAVALRAAALGEELRVLEADEAVHPDPAECAATALRARSLPEVAALWPSLQPEVPLFAVDADGALVAGRADALSIVGGRVEVVVDWKSDLDPSPADRAAYADQVAAYLRVTGAPRGLLVYLSRGELTWVEARS